MCQTLSLPLSSPSLTAYWPQRSTNQQISTVTLMSEIAYEGNLFPMVGPMINAHWQHVFPRGALLGYGSCVTPPSQRWPHLPLRGWHPTGRGINWRCFWGSALEIMEAQGFGTAQHWILIIMVTYYPYFTLLKVVIWPHVPCYSWFICCVHTMSAKEPAIPIWFTQFIRRWSLLFLAL